MMKKMSSDLSGTWNLPVTLGGLNQGHHVIAAALPNSPVLVACSLS